MVSKAHPSLSMKLSARIDHLIIDVVIDFIVNVVVVVATKSVRAKIDQMSRKVVIASTTHRTFGRQQWSLLRQELQEWQSNLNDVLSSLQSVMTTQH